MERSITKLGYSVDVTTSSKKALQLFKTNPDKYDLVISDQTMPEITGEALCREILRIRPDVPIVMCTGYSVKIDKDKAQSLGITNFLMKPATRTELAATIRESIDGNQTVTPNNNPA